MGLLSVGQPMTWEETKKLSQHVREHGIIQFINLYKRLKDRQGDVLKWGDEIEYILVTFDDKERTAKVCLRAHEILSTLQIKEEADPEGVKSLWRPEYGAYMVEGTPGQPYGGMLAHFNIVEANMRYRREEVEELLKDGEAILSITSFPRLGCENFSHPPVKATPHSGATRSLFFPDGAIFPGHPRFATLSRNIRERRGEKVAINIPIYRDERTPIPIDDSHKKDKAARPDHIYMDAMGFGMGCCCLQLTFQACNINEARTLYDQLTPLAPIMLALTAASPLHRGFVADIDCRWNIIASSVDDRTDEERGLRPLQSNRFVINKSRFDSIDSYLSPEGDKFNDVPLIYDEKVYKKLRDHDIDHLLAQHIAHLFIRDSISLFSEKVHQNDEQDTDHFENIQSTNWQTLRFKPPPPNSTIGWRVEFRPCEIQITDFENAAIVCFVVLVTRVILSFKLNFLIPISKVDENMKKAQKRNAVLAEHFWFRRDVSMQTAATQSSEPQEAATASAASTDVYTPMTVNEIINGKNGEFPGLIPLINNYLSGMDVDADTHCTIQRYLKFISRRASGEILTTATWIRQFVTGHPNYEQDSRVTDEINYDLLKTIKGIQSGEIPCPELLGYNPVSKTTEDIPPVIAKVAGH